MGIMQTPHQNPPPTLTAHRHAFTPPPGGDFPAMFWSPTATKDADGKDTTESRVFNAPEDVPEGWLPTHPNNPALKAKPAVKKLDEPEVLIPMTREEVLAELEAGGIAYSKKSKDSVLYKLLVDKLQDHLKAAGVEYPANSTAKQLLLLVPKPE